MSATIQRYALYGDAPQPGWLDMVHFERIHDRSSLYDFQIAPHLHDGLIQVLYLTRGGGEAIIEGFVRPLFPQTLIVIPAGHVHGFRFTPDVDGPSITAAQRPLEALAAVSAPDVASVVRTPQVLHAAGSTWYGDALMPLFDAIERESRMHRSGQTAAGPPLLLAVFVLIRRIAAALQTSDGAANAPPTRKATRVDRFRALVDAHFRERWSVERYASEVGLTAGQLSRLCREVLGMSSLDVMNSRVVHEAERELVYSTLTIKQVAAVLGFEDEAYFGRFFRKHTGTTPSEFRSTAHRRLATSAPHAELG